MDSRTRNILAYARSNKGRSFGGGFADYTDEDLQRALSEATTDQERAAIERELRARAYSKHRGTIKVIK